MINIVTRNIDRKCHNETEFKLQNFKIGSENLFYIKFGNS
jgi:hypothetical protein